MGRVCRLAVAIVQDAGLSVVLDGTFLKAKRRNAARKAAVEHTIPFTGVWVTQESHIAARKLSTGSSDSGETGLHVRLLCGRPRAVMRTECTVGFRCTKSRRLLAPMIGFL